MLLPSSDDFAHVLAPDHVEEFDDGLGVLYRLHVEPWDIQVSYEVILNSFRVLLTSNGAIVADCYLEQVEVIKLLDTGGIEGLEAFGKLDGYSVKCVLHIRPAVSLSMHGLRG